MKKILGILIALLILPLTVNADMSAPMIKEYSATVKNVEGVAYYGYDMEKSEYVKKGILEYGKEVKIQYESKINDVLYGSFDMGNGFYYVNVDGLTIIDDKFDINDENVSEYEDNSKNVVLFENGISMHKGPAAGFTKIGKNIPKGTVLKFTHVYSEEESPWYYTEYNGQKGWVSTLDGSIGVYNENTIMIAKQLDMMKTGDSTQKVGTIPVNTVIKGYYEIDPWSRGYYVTYNGISGYISKYEVAFKSAGKQSIELVKNNKLYNEMSEETTFTNVPSGTTLTYQYYVDDYGYRWIYTTYNGQKGWLCFSEEDVVENNEEDIKENDEEIEEDDTEIIEDEEDSEDVELYLPEEDIIIEDDSMSTRDIIILCVGVAVITAITTVVIIKLVNKKKENKSAEKDNSVETTNINIESDNEVIETESEINNSETVEDKEENIE